ncbi:hypothetical protein D3C75_382950 [compost metagenome]
MHQFRIRADITTQKRRSEIGRSLILFNIADRGNLQAQAFSNGLLTQAELFTGVAKTNASGKCCILVVSGFSIHSLQLLVREN